MTQEQLNEQLIETVKANDIDAVKKAIEDGVDVNVRDKYGYIFLHRAALWGHTEITKMLLDAGANVNTRNYEYGDTPLALAVEYEQAEIADLLKQHGGVE